MGVEAIQHWYFVCFVCNTTFFSTKCYENCSRCGCQIRSREQREPPWKRSSERTKALTMDSDANVDPDSGRLLKTVAFALRHCPEKYFLLMDADGWVELDHLLLAMRYQRNEWSTLGIDDLKKLAGSSGRERLEISGNRIRALYGHSIVGIRESEPQQIPPTMLYHGTCRTVLSAIFDAGIRPMNRSRVHLTSDYCYANQVAHVKAAQPIVLGVLAHAACSSGIRFWSASTHVWLTVEVPPQFIVT